MIAENRARATGTVGFAARTMSYVSFPISSPSVSKSVAMVTRSARFASFWTRFTIFRSVGVLIVRASIRERGVCCSERQFVYPGSKSISTTWPRRPTTVVSPNE